MLRWLAMLHTALMYRVIDALTTPGLDVVW